MNRAHNAVRGPTRNKALLLNSSEQPPIRFSFAFEKLKISPSGNDRAEQRIEKRPI